MTSIKYNPRSLTVLARETINCNYLLEDIKQLELPKCLIAECDKHYLMDNIMNPKALVPIEEDDVVFPFTEPFVDVGVELYLTIMKWPYSDPYAADEWTLFTHISYNVWHTNIQDGWITSPVNALRGACFWCVRQYAKYREEDGAYNHMTIQKIVGEEYISGPEHLSNMQDERYWCSMCYTRACFYFSDAPYVHANYRHLGMFYSLNDTTSFELVDGKWTRAQ